MHFGVESASEKEDSSSLLGPKRGCLIKARKVCSFSEEKEPKRLLFAGASIPADCLCRRQP
jgi:hypothetical protein